MSSPGGYVGLAYDRRMYRRAWIALPLLLATGCFLDREPVGVTPPGVDGGPSADGGQSCPASGCDDGNPCTDEACVMGRCVFTPNTADCDDGVFCNGPDRCQDGVCTPSDEDPCPGVSTCDPEEDACVGCESASDCPEPTRMDGECVYESICASSGNATDRITSYSCDTDAGRCVAETRGGVHGLQVSGRPSDLYGDAGGLQRGGQLRRADL